MHGGASIRYVLRLISNTEMPVARHGLNGWDLPDPWLTLRLSRHL